MPEVALFPISVYKVITACLRAHRIATGSILLVFRWEHIEIKNKTNLYPNTCVLTIPHLVIFFSIRYYTRTKLLNTKTVDKRHKMARGKSVNISQVKQIICKELIGLNHSEIANDLDLHHQTIDRITKNENYHTIRKHLSDYLMRLSTSEIMRI